MMIKRAGISLAVLILTVVLIPDDANTWSRKPDTTPQLETEACRDTLVDNEYYPRGKIFPMVVLGGRDNTALDEIAASPFNGYNPYKRYKTMDQAIKECEYAAERGLFVVMRTKFLYDERFDTDIETFVTTLSRFDNIAWWYMKEEQKIWKDEDRVILEEFYEAVQKCDPRRRPCVHYFPNGFDAEQLAQYMHLVEIIYHGAYTDWVKRPRTFVRWAVGECVEGIAQTGAPLCNIAAFSPQMFYHEETRTTLPHEAFHDAWLGIVSGAKAVIIYSFNRRNEQPEIWQQYVRFADQITGSGNLGPVILFGDTPQTIVGEVIDGPEQAKSFSIKRKRESFPSLSWLQKEYEGSIYLFAVNSTADDVIARFDGIPDSVRTVEVLFEDRCLSAVGGHFSDEFGEYSVHVYRMTR